MINSVLLQLERKSFATDRTSQFLLLAFLLLCLYAVIQGASHRNELISATDAFVESETKQVEAWRSRLMAIESGDVKPEDDRFAGLAMDVVVPVVRQRVPLSDLATGVTDLKPGFALVSQWRSVDRQFGRYQFQSPVGTSAGSFDFVFVLIFVMPLVMILVSYDVIADDRDRGRLDILMAQPITERRLVATRLAFRLGLIFSLLTLSLCLAIFVGGAITEARLGAISIFALSSAVYFLLWAAVLYRVVSWRKSSESTIVTLIAIWVINSIVVPAVLSAAAETLYPTPSRLEALNEARSVANDAFREKSDVMQGMLLDHPDLTVDNYSLPDYIRTNYVVARSVDDAIAPLLTSFDSVQQKRLDFLSVFRFLSPAALTIQSLNRSAGSDLSAQLSFEGSVRAYKMALSDALSERVLAGERLTVADYDQLPVYKAPQHSIGAKLRNSVVSLLFMLLVSCVLFWRGSKLLDRPHKEQS